MNRGMRMSIRRHSSGCWSSTVTHNGTVHVAKSSTASPSDAALSALDLKRHLAFLAGSAQPVVHARFCACCSDGFGWVWNLHTQDAEPCPLCDGHGEADVLIGSTTWGNDGAEPIYATQRCQECRGTGVKPAKTSAPRRPLVDEERLPF